MQFRDRFALFALGAGLLFGANVAVAQVVTVTGVGDDASGALNDAKRNAVQQVVGTYIDSHTVVQEAVVVLDEIYAKSQGFVKNIEVLEEGRQGALYRIRARIDVDTRPDSALMGQLKTVMALNNPRIAVSITIADGGEGGDKGRFAAQCEGTVNERLLAEGFSHVIRAKTLANDTGQLDEKSRDADYLVVGRIAFHTTPILLPKYADYTDENAGAPSVETGLTKSVAVMDAQIFKTDTQEVVGEFHVEGDGLKNDDVNAENQAVETLAAKAAEEVRKIFARAGARVGASVQIIARADSKDTLAKLEAVLRGLPGVQGVTMRGYAEGKGTLHVDTDMRPPQLLRRLSEAGVGVFLEQMSANVLEISVS